MSKSQHKIVLTDELWMLINERAVLEETTASGLCDYVIQHYLSLAPEERPQIQLRQVHENGGMRSLYIDKASWAKLRVLKVQERRPISAIIEQQMRLYLGLAI